MVEINEGQYLLDGMMDMGPVVSSGFGIAARTDGAIIDYHRGCGIDLEPWEFKAVRKMCQAYLSGLQSGANALSIAPMEREG